MTVEEQRKLGIVLAGNAGAPKTLALIKDINSRYEDIFRSGIEELGIEKVAPLILEYNNPDWALSALRNSTDAGEFTEPLIKLASSLHDNIVDPGNTTSFDDMKKISSFQLDVVAGASYAASFTMYWYSPVNGPLPQTNYPNSAAYKFSGQIPVGQSTSQPCSYFQLPMAPLNPNDTVWMVVALCGGSWYATGTRYTYDPTSTCKAIISAAGGLASPVFNAVVTC